MSDQLRGQGILPASVWRRAGDFVFVSSLYPLGADGLIVRTPGPFEYAGPSEMAAQTRSVLSALALRARAVPL